MEIKPRFIIQINLRDELDLRNDLKISRIVNSANEVLVDCPYSCSTIYQPPMNELGLEIINGPLVRFMAPDRDGPGTDQRRVLVISWKNIIYGYVEGLRKQSYWLNVDVFVHPTVGNIGNYVEISAIIKLPIIFWIISPRKSRAWFGTVDFLDKSSPLSRLSVYF